MSFKNRYSKEEKNINEEYFKAEKIKEKAKLNSEKNKKRKEEKAEKQRKKAGKNKVPPSSFTNHNLEYSAKQIEMFNRLGLRLNAQIDEIRKAYHRLALQYHPDKFCGDDNKFKEILEAYEFLTIK